MATGGRPQRRSTDHYHPEYWEESEQHRYEDRIATELYAIRAEVRKLGERILFLMGGLGLMAFLLPLIAPLIRSMFNIP